MWNWFNCYLSGRHEFGVWCAPGAIFLRCVHCGKRTNGISIEPRFQSRTPSVPPVTGGARTAARVVPFSRVASGS